MPSRPAARTNPAILDEPCVLYIDGGTTRTRGWAAVGESVVGTERVAVGARDTAREGSAQRVSEALHNLVGKVGDPALGGAGIRLVRERGLDPRVVDEEEREAAFRTGCRAVRAAGQIEAPAEGSTVVGRPPR